MALERTLDDQLELVQIKRSGYIIVCPCLHGLDRRRHGRMSGHDDDRDVGIHRLEFRYDLDRIILPGIQFLRLIDGFQIIDIVPLQAIVYRIADILAGTYDNDLLPVHKTSLAVIASLYRAGIFRQ